MFLGCTLLLWWREWCASLIVARLLTELRLWSLLLGFYRHDVVRPDVIDES